MATPDRRARKVRAAALVMALLITAAVGFTYLSYAGAFARTDQITVTSSRAGLVMDRDAKVKFLGVQIGQVKDIEYDGASAQLTLAIRRDEMARIPANVIVEIASTTVFGAKSVAFLPPEQPSADRLKADAHLQASDVAVEVNTLFDTLVDTLNKIDPVELNSTVSALSNGLHTNGSNAGEALVGLNEYMAKINPLLPTLESDIRKVGTVADIYAEAADDLNTALGHIPTISRAITDEQRNLTDTLTAATGLAEAGTAALGPAENDLIAAVQRLRVPLQVAGDYSPEYSCLITALASAYKKFGPYIGGIKPALFVNAGFIPGSAAYTYPESLPIVNASGGPNCRGLPNVATKQGYGSWYRPPFLVTDNAYVPYQPNTELQFDAPSTLQFLFNGAYAEQDDY